MARKRKIQRNILPGKVTHVTLTATDGGGYRTVARSTTGERVWFNFHRTYEVAIREARRKASYFGVEWRDETQD